MKSAAWKIGCILYFFGRLSLYVTGPITSAIVNGSSHLGANFWYRYGNLRFMDSRKTLSSFWKVVCFLDACLAIDIAACACEAMVFS